jgi:PEP-CTERM motif
MKFAIKSLAFAAALVAGSAQAVIVTVGGGATTVVDPSGATTREAQFSLLSGYSGGNVNASAYSTGGDLIFSSGTYIGGSYIPGLTGTSVTPSNISAVSGTLGALNVGQITMTGQGGVTVTETFRARNTDKTVYASRAAAIASLSNPATMGYTTSSPGALVPLVTTANQATVTRISSKANSTIASLDAVTTGPNAGQILSANAVGGAFQQGTFISGTLNGGTLLVENIRFDLVSRAVIADVTGDADPVDGEDDTPAVSVSGMTMWTWGVNDTSGPTSLNPDSVLAANPVSALTADGFTLLDQRDSTVSNWRTPAAGDFFQKYTVLAPTTFNNLQITPVARQFFIDSFGLGPTGVTALDAVNNSIGGWGKVASNIVFEVQEVPEPSTYALMGLGLVGISLVARRRSAAK